MLLLLPHINDQSRCTEEEFWSDFERAWPYLLGSLLDAVVAARRRVPHLKPTRLPRLADFARRAAAAALALGWDDEQFLEAYEQNRRVGHVTAIEGSAVAKTITRMMDGREVWNGTAASLLMELNAQPDKKPRTWPKSALSLANALRRIAPNLRELGIRVEFDRGTDRNRTRIIVITRLSEDEPPVASGASEASDPDSVAADARVANEPQASAEASGQFRFASDDMDDADAPSPSVRTMEGMAQRFATCAGCGQRPAPEGELCFRCAVLDSEPLL